ncbi:hypothetical protein RUND412_010012 [Rhizina undulata]
MFSRTAYSARLLARPLIPRSSRLNLGPGLRSGMRVGGGAGAGGGLAVAGRRTFLNDYRERLAWELETGNWKKYKLQIGLAVSMWIITITAVGTAVYKYYDFVQRTMHNFPSSVSKELRRALYYKYADNAQDTIRHLQAALKAAAAEGMDPLSDEVTGIKIELAGVLEKFQRADKTIEVLEHVLKQVLEGKEKYTGRDKTRLMKKAVEIQIKLGGLYSGFDEDEKALGAFVWGVETILRERQRREAGKVDVELEGGWFTDEEVASAFESLASQYDKTGQHQFATPLYLQALDLLPGVSCHSVILMNNVAAAISQSPAPSDLSRRDLIENSAKKWAQKALDVASDIKPPERTEECDVGCAVAISNLAEMAEMLGAKEEAEFKFREALSLAKGMGFKEGILKAEEGLTRLGAEI